MEISDRIKKVEHSKDFLKDRKDMLTAVSNFKKSGEGNYSAWASPGDFKKSGNSTQDVL